MVAPFWIVEGVVLFVLNSHEQAFAKLFVTLGNVPIDAVLTLVCNFKVRQSQSLYD